MRHGWAGRGLRTVTGLTLGAATAGLEAAFLLSAGLVLAVSVVLPVRSTVRRDTTRKVLAVCFRLAQLERRRLARFHASENAEVFTPRRALEYLAVRWLVGALGGFVLLLLLFGLAVAASMLTAWILGGSWSFVEDSGGVSTLTLVTVSIPGAVLLYLNVMGILGVEDLDRRTARHFLGPSPRELLEQRVTELAASRADVVRAVNNERRRIERDLHDGVQQRLVALGMLLGRARRTEDAARGQELLRQAHEEAQQALHDLREVAWRVYPTALDQLGLADVLSDLADRSAVLVNLDYRLAGRPPAPVETVAYFVVSEAVTNAVKHAAADRIDIVVEGNSDEEIVIRVSDDGEGGADPAGRGLIGLAGRVVAMDGRFEVSSPAGGPTTITAVLPCG
jgi:signal transduction histidine kinase